MGTSLRLLFTCVPSVKISVRDRADRTGHTRGIRVSLRW